MDPVKLVLGAMAVVIVVTAYVTASAHSRRVRGRRAWLIAGSILALALVPLLIPWVDRMSPSLRESPGGLLVVVPKAAAVSLLALVACGTLLGALMPWRGRTD
jgi:hypothetical protein